MTNEIETIKFETLKPSYNDKYENILLPFLKVILESGKYKVYSSADLENFSYFMVCDGNNIAYIQKEYFSGVSMSTQHHPNRNTGTGHQIIAEDIKPTLEKLNVVLKTKYKDNIYYSNFEDYQKIPINQILKYREVTL